MMACSYLSAAMKPEHSGAACWTPPTMPSCSSSDMEPTMPMAPPYLRPPMSTMGLLPTSLPSLPQEPALDLTTAALKPQLPSPPSDETE